MDRYDHERALPPLEDVLAELEAGQLEYFDSQENRDGKPYRIVPLLGPEGQTATGLHRIIAASTLGRWVDRRANVDHINHDPSDNRPENLEIVAPSENQLRRRQRLDVSKAADHKKVKKHVSDKQAKNQRLQEETQEAIDHYLAMTNRYIGHTSYRTAATSSQSFVVAPPPAKTIPNSPPDERLIQEKRDAFAAKYAHRRK